MSNNHKDITTVKSKISALFKSDTSILIFGTLISQMIPFGVQPILRRMYSPEEFGTFALYFSFVSIAAFISTLNFHSAITVPKEEKTAKDLVLGSLTVSFLLSLLFFVIILINNYLELVPVKTLGLLVFLIPISTFFGGAHLIFTNWFTRKKEFKLLAANKVIRRVSEASGQSIFAFNLKNGGLVLGNILGDFVFFLIYIFSFRKDIKKENYNKVSIKKSFKEYSSFPKKALIPTILNITANYIPVFLITEFFSKEITGQLDLSRQVLALPLALISASVSSILLQKYSELKNNNDELLSTTKKFFIPLFVLGILGSLVIFFFGVGLFTFVFGDEWNQAGEFAEIMIFYYFLMFLVSPFSVVLISLEKLTINGIWQLFRFTTLVVLLFFKFDQIETFIITLTIIEIINYLIYAGVIFSEIRKYETRRIV